MRFKILFLFVIFSGLWACQDDKDVFDVPVEFRKDLSFRPIPGGSVMKYYLPKGNEVFGLRVRYNDARGIEIIKEGTYLSDSLQLIGFNEARQNVPALLTFFDNNMVESAPIEIAFDTEDSAPVAFFDNLTVTPFWGGFSVSYRSPETVDGMAHIFYIGTNPLTHQPDSILMLSTPIVEGGDTLNFQLQQKQETTTVVVRTEDYRGYRVKQEIFADLPCLYMDTLTPADFTFDFTGEIVTNDEFQFGEEYLFDEDVKGTSYRQNLLNGDRYKHSTFLAGPNAFGERFIIDLKQERIPASVRLYAYLNYNTSWLFPGASGGVGVVLPEFLCELWDGSYRSKLPSQIKLYGTNKDPYTVDLSSCALLYSLDNDRTINGFLESWAQNTDDYFTNSPINYRTATDEQLNAATPVYLEMLCNYSESTYRYLIFVVENTFQGGDWMGGEYEANGLEYVTFNELEVYVKAE